MVTSGLMPLVFAMSNRYPIKRIGKHAPHAEGRLGVP